MFGKNILTNTNKRSIIIIVNSKWKRKDPSISYKRCWRISDIGQVFIHTHKFVDQNGREFDIADYYAILLLHILINLVKLFLSISANFFQFIWFNYIDLQSRVVSSVGESNRLISDRSSVQVWHDPLIWCFKQHCYFYAFSEKVKMKRSDNYGLCNQES